MKLTKKLETEILKVYNDYWDCYFNGDMRAFASMLHKNVQIIGSSENEVFNNKQSAMKFYKSTVGQVAGKTALRNRKISMRLVGNGVMITEQSDFYALIGGQWTFYGPGRISTLLCKIANEWKIIHQHGSFPDYRAGEGEQLNTEKIKAENLQLRDAVKRRTAELENKNRELEIEAALERVRAVAMGMKKPEDMLDVCRVISEQLQQFGVEHIRNVQTAIIDEQIGQYLCYQFFTPYDKTAVEKTEYLKSPVEHEMVKQMLASRDGHFIGSITGKKLKDFRTHRKEENHFPDPFLDEASELSYCFLSIGEGGLGLSLYQSMADDVLILFKRFHQVFSLAYQRFRDIQKAEAQAREAQIEAALERVRSRAMAMHKSEELSEAGELLYKELSKLGIENLTTGYVLFNDNATIGYSHGVNPMTGSIRHLPVGMPHNETWVMKSIVASWKKKEPLLVLELDPEETIAHQTFIAERSSNFPISVEQLLSLSPERLKIHVFNFSQGYLLIVGGTLLTEAQQEMVTRFAKVFEQTYTRFLDLQKAEAQAREAQIEAALERVRSKSLAMHQSKELLNVVKTLYGELESLGVSFHVVGINLTKDASKDLYLWISTADGLYDNIVHWPYQDLRIFHEIQKSIETGEMLEATYSKEETKEFFTEYFKLESVPDKRKAVIQNVESIEWIGSFLSHSGLFLMRYTSGKYALEEKDIVKRFAKVFEQTYVRFLDLQKAEAQAREAQIEAALERVRSKTMAMHKTDELQDVVRVVAEELKNTGVILDTGGAVICTYFQDSKDVMHWTASEDPAHPSVPYLLPYFKDELFDEAWTSKNRGDDYLAKVFSYDVKNAFFNHAFEHSDYRQLPDEYKKTILESKSHGLAWAWSKNSAIMIPSIQGDLPSEEEKEILIRFAKVFEQAYIRFLDLQKAETQAREAQIEAALERTRSQSMLMQHSSELNNVSNIFHEQLLGLGIPTEFSYVWLPDEANELHQFWATWAEEQKRATRFKTKAVTYPLDRSEPYTAACFAAWKSSEPVHIAHIASAEVSNFFATWKELLHGAEKLKPEFFPDGLYYAEAYMKYGCFGINVRRLLTEDEKQILLRFSVEFERAYTRFLDLKQAEARAREAEQQASLDRVRAEIASMRSPEDLQRITPLIWRELTTLGVPFFRCGVFIIDEATELTHAYLSTPAGQALAALHMKFDSAPFIHAAVQHWRQQQVYREEWNREQFIAWTQSLVEQGMIESPEKYRAGGEAPKKLVLQFVPFTQGMLYIGSSAVLSNDEIELSRMLATAFGMAYARYEDFQKLEAAKAEVEAALDNLKKTQGQLIQAEKMASLGQLTAGIAHEIKNPLNFVINFARLSSGLMDEFSDELATNYSDKSVADVRELLDELLADLRANNAKINEHGKRADSIVKSMMQHAHGGKSSRQSTDVNALVDEYLNLTYHGMRARLPDFDANIERDFGEIEGKVGMVPQEIGRVLLNIMGNACDAVYQRAQADGNAYQPRLSVATRQVDAGVEIRISDNGTGISDEIREKIFEPFFTTKPAGSGTGLGLSLSYDIVTQGHGGTLTVESTPGEGATFVVTLPAAAT